MPWRTWVCFFVKFNHQGAFIKQHCQKYDLAKKTVRLCTSTTSLTLIHVRVVLPARI